jgi:hypothetical protein
MQFAQVDFFKVDIDEPAVSSVVAQFEITGVVRGPYFSMHLVLKECKYEH